jgi:hypothetical protein
MHALHIFVESEISYTLTYLLNGDHIKISFRHTL